ncbi:MAG TPA: isochorismatase family cysteine hydrolase [Albitalea sp.]|nr:isochorismatase family cysteine hydrolase [Albitalea sp.]
MPSRRSSPPSLAEHHAAGGRALLIVDMISSWDFPDADKLLPQAAAIAAPIAALAARCRRRGVPVIYGNDNRGQWRSDFRRVVEQSLAAGGDGAQITRQLAPGDEDYFVLKPKQSAFFGTPLDLLLRHLGAHRLLIAGVASDQCVMTSAMAARMRDYEVLVPADCVASQTAARNKRAIATFEEALNIRTTASTRLRLP